MKNLQGLLAFVETAAAGSLTGAALRLDLSPAAVSKSLARLEQQLGVRLFNRSTRRLAITPEGQRFLLDARAALRLLDQAVADVSQSAQEPAGRTRISVGIAFGQRWVLPALPAITARHPRLVIDIDLDNRPVDLVAEGFDIGIRGGFIEDSSLIARRVCALPLVLLASPAYLRRAGVPATPEDLSAHRCATVRFATGQSPVWRFQLPRGKAIEIVPQPALTSNDPEALIDLALADAGIVQAGLHHALPYLRRGMLKVLLPGVHDPGSREIVVHYPHRQYLAPRVRVVVDALLAHFDAVADLRLTLADVLAAEPGCVAAAALAGQSPARPRKSSVVSPRPFGRQPGGLKR
jgi:DNA-binding transcriptional LysR family regulator